MTPRRTRLVCTLSVPREGGGRPQDRDDYVSSLVAAGMDVARVNLSHAPASAEFAAGRRPDYGREEALLREVRKAAGAAHGARQVAVMLDLQGVKTRLRLPDPAREAVLSLDVNDEIAVRVTRERHENEITCEGSPQLLDAITRAVRAASARGETIAVAVGDGDPFLRCGRVAGDVVYLRAPERCVLGNGKGVTFRGVLIENEPPLTEKDRVDLAAFAIPALLSGDADALALSFVQDGAAVARLRAFVAETCAWFRRGARPSDAEDLEILIRLAALCPELRAKYDRDLPHVAVVAKIETACGVDHVDEILAHADAVMVARGDLGLNEAPEDVPRHQKSILRRARQMGRAAIVATQMLESMLTAPEPRRSEATDVFNAVLDGADAVMLSGETATGDRPQLAAQTLARIARAAEIWADELRDDRDAALLRAEAQIAARRGTQGAVSSVTDLVTLQVVRAAEHLGARAIVAATRSGQTARNLARFDPRVPVIAVVPDERTARRLAFTGAVQAIVAPADTADAALERGIAQAVSALLLQPGDLVVVASARPGDPPGATTCLSLVRVPAPPPSATCGPTA